MEQAGQFDSNKLLLESASKGDLETIKKLVELTDVDLNHVDSNCRSALHNAAKNGHPAIVEYLILRGANVNTIDEKGCTPLYRAVKCGQITTAKALVRLGAKTNGESLDKRIRPLSYLLDDAMDPYKIETVHFLMEIDQISPHEYSELLLKSADEGDLETIKSLIELKGADVNYYDEGYKRESALLFAARKEHTAIVEYLVLKGADVDRADVFGVTPELEAIGNGHVETTKTLLRLGAEDDSVKEYAERLLEVADRGYEVEKIRAILELDLDIPVHEYYKLFLKSADIGDLGTIKSLVEFKGIDIKNHYHGCGNALHNAASKGRSEIVEYLALKGAYLEVTVCGCTPLFMAVENGHVETAKVLVRLGARINTENWQGQNLLDAAMYCPKVESTHFVLELGLQISRGQYGKLLLESADEGNLKTIETLVKLKSIDINYRQCNGLSALHNAASKGRSEIVEYLALEGAYLEPTVDGYTPLSMAVRDGQVETAKMLVRLGAKIGTKNRKGQNLLDVAMSCRKVESTHFVLELGLQISAHQYSKLLLISADKGDLRTIETLVELKSIDINHTDCEGMSALHNAVEKGHEAIVQYLALNGADVNRNAPLFRAVKLGHIGIAKILIKHGAKTDIVIKDGRRQKNLINVAEDRHQLELIRCILEHGVDIDQYDKAGFTLLMQVCRTKNESCIAFLLERDADYRKYSIPNGLSPLHLMMSNWSGGIMPMKLLIEHIEISEGEEGMLDYVNYNGTTNGQTALHLACIKRNYGAVKLLLHSGANPGIRDKSGKVPYDYNRLNARDHQSRQIRSVFDEMQ